MCCTMRALRGDHDSFDIQASGRIKRRASWQDSGVFCLVVFFLKLYGWDAETDGVTWPVSLPPRQLFNFLRTFFKSLAQGNAV